METDELIKNIKNGDEKSFELLLNSHHNMIYKIIYALDLDRGDFLADVDSLYQEGSLALYKAVFTYKKENEMSFTSYAYMVVRARLHTYLRDTYHNTCNDCFSIDNPENIDFDIVNKHYLVSDDPIDYHREKEFEEHLHKFVSKLTNEDQQIFNMRSQDYTYKQIAERLHIKTKRIDNRLRVLRRRLKKYIESENE